MAPRVAAAGALPKASSAPPAKRPRPEPVLPDLAALDGAAPAGAAVMEMKPWLEDSLTKCFGGPGFEQFKGQVAPHTCQPLDITKEFKERMTSYKEPWKSDRCTTALQSTSMYEAGGNLFWVNWRRPSGQNEAIAGTQPRWSQVEEIATRFFSRESLVGGAGVRQRIVFPVPLLVHAPSLDNARGSTFEGSLEMLTGHIWVWGWARGLAGALTINDTTLVRALWEAALTVTLHLRVDMTPAAQAAATIADSELQKLRDRLAADSFLAFARKCWVIFGSEATTVGSKTNTLKALGVTYGGAAVTKTMLTAILHLGDRFSDKAVGILQEIEYKHGREVLTLAYTKLGRLGQLVGATGLTDMTPKNVAEYFLEYVKFGLDFEIFGPKDVTAEWLDKQKDGTPGVLVTTLGRQQLVVLVGSWVDDLKTSPQGAALYGELSLILPTFASYSAYEAAFPVEPAADSTPAQPQGSGAAADDEDAVEKVKRRFHNSASHAAINFLYDVMAGVHDTAIKEAVRAASLKDAKWMDSSTLTPLRDLYRTLTAHRAMVQLSGGPPAPETRVLQRYKSEACEDDESELRKERAETWKQVAALRKKYNTIISVRAATSASYQTAYEKSFAFKLDNLKAGEAHRVFLFSSDLFTEAGHEPWVGPAVWPDGAEAAVKFITQQRGPGDLLCFFDGRSRQCRRAIEKLTEESRYVMEIFVVYSPTHRLGRRVAWSGANCEVCVASLLVNKTLIAAKDRAGTFNAAGESSTHDTTYSGVQPVPWGALPLLSAADKAKLLAQPQENVEQPRQGVFDCAGDPFVLAGAEARLLLEEVVR